MGSKHEIVSTESAILSECTAMPLTGDFGGEHME